MVIFSVVNERNMWLIQCQSQSRKKLISSFLNCNGTYNLPISCSDPPLLGYRWLEETRSYAIYRHSDPAGRSSRGPIKVINWKEPSALLCLRCVEEIFNISIQSLNEVFLVCQNKVEHVYNPTFFIVFTITSLHKCLRICACARWWRWLRAQKPNRARAWRRVRALSGI